MNTQKNDELDKEGWETTFIPTFRKSSVNGDTRILVPLLKLLCIPFGVYFALLIQQDIWFAFFVGAVILFATRKGIIEEQVKENGSSNPARVALGIASQKLIAYLIIFFLVLMPLAALVQEKYDLSLLPQKYNVFNRN